MTIRLNKLAQIRALLDRIADGSADPRSSAQDAIVLLDELIAGASRGGRGEADIEYIVEDSVNGPVLTEYRRAGKAHPFRCPKAIYDATVQVLAVANRAMPLDEIVAQVGQVLGSHPADYQVRVPLRLWMNVAPPLVVRMRARYSATDAKSFNRTAKTLWADLRPR